MSQPSHYLRPRDYKALLSASDAHYKVTVAPGEVRYLLAKDFFQADSDVEQVIDEIRNVASRPVIEFSSDGFYYVCGPDKVYFSCHAVDALFTAAEWDERLRAHHAVYRFAVQHGISFWVYVEFHRYLRLDRHFAFAECAEAVVKRTLHDSDLARSYAGSPSHIVIEPEYSEHSEYLVVAKTSFVQSRLDAILDEEEAKHTVEQTERLQRSKFATFVYLMEDIRNAKFKIGRSKTPGKRERTLQSEVPETVLRFSIPADESHEITLHERFRHRRVRGEWFELSAEEVVEIVNYLKAEGDAERATVDFKWLGELFFRARRQVP